jgi:hypothetical protein
LVLKLQPVDPETATGTCSGTHARDRADDFWPHGASSALLRFVFERRARRDKIVPAKKENAMSDDDMKAELERLRRENAALKKGASDGIRMKVSEKGAVSVYGMGRFPVTLYKEQWLKLLNMSDEIRAFIAENEERLKAKD